MEDDVKQGDSVQTTKYENSKVISKRTRHTITSTDGN